MHKRISIFYIISFFLSTFFCETIFAQDTLKPEFRGVWIATVDNIDWPVVPTINSEEQKASFIQLIEMHKRNGINALIVQVRPATDAIYPSPFEPWSQWLTGVQGQPPSPYYDPLEFMITETHKRGMEFHAWLNPYRAVFSNRSSSLSATHITKIHPEWFLTYGDKRYFDPSNKEAQKYVAGIVKDIVSRYDVDGIHFDDYFYPYPIAGKEFPDDAAFKKYGNGLTKADWRRSNTDSIIVMVHKVILEQNKKCRFGISPFGVWRNADKDPEGSATKAGPTNYDVLYADILLWLKNGWIDYVAPQLYWEFENNAAPFGVLVDWWSKHSYGKSCYIGLGMYRANTNFSWRNKNQLPRQITKIRNTANVQGMIIYSSKSIEKNLNGWSDSLRLNYFKYPAPIPK